MEQVLKSKVLKLAWDQKNLINTKHSSHASASENAAYIR